MKTHLIISVDLEGEEEELISSSQDILERFYFDNIELLEKTKCSLIREGDRSALNILLPKLKGRFGEHFQGRKASLNEIVKKEGL